MALFRSLFRSGVSELSLSRSEKNRSRKRRNGAKHHYWEALEPRTLLSASSSLYAINGVTPSVGAYDSAGHLWVVNTSGQGDASTVLQEISSSQTILDTIDISSTSPAFIASGNNGHMYISDFNGGIDDVNLSSGVVTPYLFTDSNDSTMTPFQLTVTGNGNVWFTTLSDEGTTDDNTNIVGRWTPGSATADFETLPSITSDSNAVAIASAGADSVWVGLNGVDDGVISGANHIVQASFASGAFTTPNVYAVNSGNSVTDANNHLTSVASDGSGGVWYSLANIDTTGEPTLRTQEGPDTIVHGTLTGGALNQTGYSPSDASATTSLNISSLSVDGKGDVWFAELDGNNADYFDPTAQNIMVTPYPDGTQAPDQLIASPTTGEATVLTSDPAGSYAQFEVQASQTITFSYTTTNLSGQQGFVFNNQEIATFTAPPLASGHYTATISWGDNTTTVVTATTDPNIPNTYDVTISGKSFAQQGTYAGSIAITDPSNNSIGSLTFTSTITDIPLDVTSFSGVDVIAGITAAAGTFTDDPNLPVSTWTATINWGDNTTSQALIVKDAANPGEYLIVGLHQYKKKGTYTLTLTVTTSEADALITDNTITTTVVVR